MTDLARGAIYSIDQIIKTEIEFDGTIAGVFVLIFSTPEEAQAYKSNSTLKHLLPFYDEENVEGCRVRLRRKTGPIA